MSDTFKCIQHIWFNRKKVELTILRVDSRLRSAGMTDKKQALKIVILGLDPGIQGVLNFSTEDTHIPATICYGVSY